LDAPVAGQPRPHRRAGMAGQIVGDHPDRPPAGWSQRCGASRRSQPAVFRDGRNR
jgi:hypothetical protein